MLTQSHKSVGKVLTSEKWGENVSIHFPKALACPLAALFIPLQNQLSCQTVEGDCSILAANLSVVGLLLTDTSTQEPRASPSAGGRWAHGCLLWPGKRLWARSHFCPVKCQSWCLAESLSQGRRELAVLALHRMSEALRNFLLSRSPSCWNPHPALFWVWPAWRGALLCYSSQDSKPTLSQHTADWNSSAG